MILVLSSLFLLEICLSSANIPDPATVRPTPAVKESRINLSSHNIHNSNSNSKSGKIFGEKGNYLSTVIRIDVLSFSDATAVNDVDDSTEKFKIHYSNIKFYKLSSAYALSYRIDLDANMAKIQLCLGKGQIKGHYCACEPSAVCNKTEDFEVNLYAHLSYSHDLPFQVEDGKVVFGKVDNHRFLFDEVVNKYANPLSTLADELTNYVSPELLEAVTVKISEEICQKVSLDDVAAQIKTEIALKYRNEVAERFKKAIDDAFEDMHLNSFNVLYHDVTNFNCIVENYDVTIPTFTLRDAQGVYLDNVEISFAGNSVYGKAKWLLASPLALFDIVYRDRNNPRAENKRVTGEYKVVRDCYEMEMIANLDTATVELGTVNVNVSHVEVSSTQGLYRDERDIIIRHLPAHLHSYFTDNSYYPVSRYCQGLIAEGRIAHQVFKR